MAIINLKYFSEALMVQTDFYVIIPQEAAAGEIGNDKKGGERKNLLLPHGLSDDNTIWTRRTSIERYADKYGINVIMPSADRSFYTDMKYGGKYYEHIAKEIPAVASSYLKLPQGRENWYVAGLSMGGYGAMKIALKENDFFSGAAALSPVTIMQNPLFADTLVPVFGENAPIPPSEDLFCLTEEFKERKNNPRLLIINGTEDFMFDDYLKFLDHIEPMGYDFKHKEYPGIHNWDFWDEHITEVIEWMKGE